MLKKMLLCSFLGINLVHATDNKVDLLPLGALAAVVGAGSAVYLVARESNEAKIERAGQLMQLYEENMHLALMNIQTVLDIKNYVESPAVSKNKNQEFFDKVKSSYQEIDARYNSWFKPWNWNKKMKHAFEQIRELHNIVCLLEIMGAYQLCMCEGFKNSPVEQQVHAFCLGKSSYPALYSINRINKDLNFLQNTKFKVNCNILMTQYLGTLLIAILSSEMCIQERRHQEALDIEKTKAHALHRQASAQEQQAHAAYLQATAQFERNSIERAKR